MVRGLLPVPMLVVCLNNETITNTLKPEKHDAICISYFDRLICPYVIACALIFRLLYHLLAFSH